MKYIDNILGYACYENNEGFLEGYRSSGKVFLDDNGNFIPKSCKRIVTNARTPENFVKYILGLRSKKAKKEEDTSQLELF